MNIEQAITKYSEAAREKRIECTECRDINDLENAQECYNLSVEYEQLSKWLTELKRYQDKENEVYIVYSAELDVRSCILGVFSNMEAAQDFEDHCYSEGIGSILIEEATVRDRFNIEDEQL